MFSFLPAPIKGTVSFLLFGLNTLFWCLLLFLALPFKVFFPELSNRWMVAIAQNWISCNTIEIKLMHRIRWDVKGLENLRPDRSYLVVSNHQSWIDIVVLQEVFNRRIPFLRFFLKQELIYVPILGLAWWALDFPFMKRYTKAYLEKHPEKRGQDLETTRKACERFKGAPISVLNFLEGTRFTPDKHRKQNSTYGHLLNPKIGGVAFVLEAMGEQFESLLDVTIQYPGGAESLWGLLSGQVDDVVVHVREIPIPRDLIGGKYLSDENFRERLQNWVRSIWSEKDLRLKSLYEASVKAD